MEQLGTYKLTQALSNQNAGYSLWGFGTKNGREYFLKQFVEKKYPVNDTESSPARLQKKRTECARYEQRKRVFYHALNEFSDGNAVRVEEFFRIGSKYYAATQKIEGLHIGVPEISGMPRRQIKRLCAIIAHAVGSVHRGGVVHADLKPDNILFAETPSGDITAKIIDFDSGFLESAPPSAGDEIVGDFNYFSPEACRSIWGEEMKLTCKMDVFALGVLFHQFFTGQLPRFNLQESSYPGEAAAKGELLTVSGSLPKDIRNLLGDMLNPDPDKRPTALEVHEALLEKTGPAPGPTPPPGPGPAPGPNPGGSPFFRPGDL